jgi:hypothetical protein
MRAIRRIIVHHSAGKPTETVHEIRRFHMNVRGYADIGYHWIVRQVFEGGPWTLEAGRPENVVGSHDGGENADSIGICILGDYTKGPVPDDAWLVLVAVVTNACRRFGRTAADVRGHKEDEPKETPTACPGFNPAELRYAVDAQLNPVDAP